MTANNVNYFLGVDVGTSSVRVGLFESSEGKLIRSESEPITVFNYQVDFYEQSSDEIFESICKCIRLVLSKEESSIRTDAIVSIGFDATCSLVVLDQFNRPVSVSPCKRDSVNVIMWMDHRAKEQADFINLTNHKCLKSVGGRISLEMDPPKILWLKENLYDEFFTKVKHFFSLPDYLVWRFSGHDVRSVCTTTCKWLYKSSEHEQHWDETFWHRIGLSELVVNNFEKIGSQVQSPLKFMPNLKISAEVSMLTGLSDNVKVGISMIDAHAAGLGAVAISQKYIEQQSIHSNEILVLVSGTSSCLMASTNNSKFIDGIWGPYFNAMLPNMWLNEAGQSASGKLLDHMIQTHPAFGLLSKKDHMHEAFEELHLILENMVAKEKRNIFDAMNELTKDMHVYPDFHGNRSPLSDPKMTGLVCGLNFDTSLNNLAIVYLACLQSLAYQIRQIIEIFNSHQITFKLITVIGGLSNNRLYTQLISDICQLPVLTVADTVDSSVLLGSAILGASNADLFKESSFDQLMQCFKNGTRTRVIEPNKTIEGYHQKKYQVFLNLVQDQLKYRQIMHTAIK